MISVEQALSLVLARVPRRAPTSVPLGEALGHTLAEDIVSDVDSPPHDKALVDGYAVRASDFSQPLVELRILEQVVAGECPTQAVTPGTATRIMTGAPLPLGADAVVMVEHTEDVPSDNRDSAARVRIREARATIGQNILRRAAALRCGETVLAVGHQIRPIEIGVLAEVGRSRVAVIPPPQVAVLATGNELVPVDRVPAAGQIRNSNGPMLAALVTRASGRAIELGIARDDEADLRRLIQRGLEADVLILSGGVSAGVLDLVPLVLQQFGVQQVFHKVDLKPGKPIWFGALPATAAAMTSVGEKLVFGLPGNPVSSLVCFELFVRPALAKLAGREADRPPRVATLAHAFRHRGDRPTYLPAAVVGNGTDGSHATDGKNVAEVLQVRLLDWKGSADLRTLADANCLAYFSPGEREYAAGASITIWEL